jgi:hypothetical protein
MNGSQKVLAQMTPQELAERIKAALDGMNPSLLAGDRLAWTAGIKKVLGDLGKSMTFMVAASGYMGKSQGEFLYDMVWYRLDQGYVLSQPMVMEVEWKVALTTVVDDDFQKLVQARADVRVWVGTSANQSDIDRHIANCQKQIWLFDGSQNGDQYVLAFFEWKTMTHVVQHLTISGLLCAT